MKEAVSSFDTASFLLHKFQNKDKFT